MCGFVGIYGSKDVAGELYDGLIVLQHRGQDTAGIFTYNGGKMHIRKSEGLVRDCFRAEHMQRLRGEVGIGHVRYPTVGAGGLEDAQPFTTNSPFGIGLAHNGNVTNFFQLKKELVEKDQRMINSDCDSEAILNVFASALRHEDFKRKIKPEHIFNAVSKVFKRVKGSYSFTAVISGQGIICVRDPYGIKPAIFGKRNSGLQNDYIFASEQVVLDTLGYDIVDDLEAGEVIFIDTNKKVHRKVVSSKGLHPCIFEFIYFARPDSVLDNISVHKARLRLGNALGKQIKKVMDKEKLDIDVVMPVPDSSRSSAMGVSEVIDVKYREGLIKNRYIGRTFIMPGQAIRKKSIKYKLNPIPFEIKGKNVLVVDDSIVRGNTSKQIIQMIRDAGAKKVYFASAAPKLISPCLYGIDIPTRQELIAHSLSVEEIKKAIGSDFLFYQELKDAIEAVKTEKSPVKKFCYGCFSGKYPTPEITEKALKEAEDQRLKAREARNQLTLLV